jgi:hypothetical protein
MSGSAEYAAQVREQFEIKRRYLEAGFRTNTAFYNMMAGKGRTLFNLIGYSDKSAAVWTADLESFPVKPKRYTIPRSDEVKSVIDDLISRGAYEWPQSNNVKKAYLTERGGFWVHRPLAVVEHSSDTRALPVVADTSSDNVFRTVFNQVKGEFLKIYTTAHVFDGSYMAGYNAKEEAAVWELKRIEEGSTMKFTQFHAPARGSSFDNVKESIDSMIAFGASRPILIADGDGSTFCSDGFRAAEQDVDAIGANALQLCNTAVLEQLALRLDKIT